MPGVAGNELPRKRFTDHEESTSGPLEEGGEVKEICRSVLVSCMCYLEPHGGDVPHECGELAGFENIPGCGGSWLGEEGAENFKIVSYPQVFPRFF